MTELAERLVDWMNWLVLAGGAGALAALAFSICLGGETPSWMAACVGVFFASWLAVVGLPIMVRQQVALKFQGAPPILVQGVPAMAIGLVWALCWGLPARCGRLRVARRHPIR